MAIPDEWSIEEREEFFAGQDAITGKESGVVMNFHPNWDVSPIGIHITSITPPEQGWPIATYCPICKETTFILSPWAIKPIDGDDFKLKDTCARDELCGQHNMKMAVSGMKPHVYERMIVK